MVWPPPEPAPGALPELRPLVPEEPLLEELEPELPEPAEPLPELLLAGLETAGAGAAERDRCEAECDGRALDAGVTVPDLPLARADPARLTPSTPAAATLAAVTVVVTARTRA